MQNHACPQSCKGADRPFGVAAHHYFNAWEKIMKSTRRTAILGVCMTIVFGSMGCIQSNSGGAVSYMASEEIATISQDVLRPSQELRVAGEKLSQSYKPTSEWSEGFKGVLSEPGDSNLFSGFTAGSGFEVPLHIGNTSEPDSLKQLVTFNMPEGWSFLATCYRTSSEIAGAFSYKTDIMPDGNSGEPVLLTDNLKMTGEYPYKSIRVKSAGDDTTSLTLYISAEESRNAKYNNIFYDKDKEYLYFETEGYLYRVAESGVSLDILVYCDDGAAVIIEATSGGISLENAPEYVKWILSYLNFT